MVGCDKVERDEKTERPTEIFEGRPVKPEANLYFNQDAELIKAEYSSDPDKMDVEEFMVWIYRGSLRCSATFRCSDEPIVPTPLREDLFSDEETGKILARYDQRSWSKGYIGNVRDKRLRIKDWLAEQESEARRPGRFQPDRDYKVWRQYVRNCVRDTRIILEKFHLDKFLRMMNAHPGTHVLKKRNSEFF